jgi:small conductance mechanosensitive channel
MTEPEPSAVAADQEGVRPRRLDELAEDPLGVVQEEVEWVATVLDSIIEYLVAYSFQFLGALVLLVVGVVVANRVSRFVLALQERREVDVTLRQFVAAVVRMIILVGFVIIALEQLGVSVAPFLAAIGGLALGASFAL